MCSMAIHVGERLLRQESLLLLSVHQTFSAFASEASLAANLNVGEREYLVTARWLLSNLIIHLQHHLSYTCCVKKCGTLLYRTNGDIFVSLSLSLHTQKGVENKDTPSTKAFPDHNEAYDEINSCVHQQIQKFLAADLRALYLFDELDIDKLVLEIDPQLWAFLRSITTSMCERKGIK